jgi:tryptophan halogenase
MPFLLNYKENELPELYTTAWAQKSGWMWQIPTMERKGCGYVFSDEFTTPDKAQEEIELALGCKIDPIRILKFDAGRLENVWTKNCLSIGLAAAFAEPLEATSIHTTIIQLTSFIFEYCQDTLEDTLNANSINIYNKNMARMYDMTKEFLVAHYTGGRTDSEFWSYISSGKTTTPLVNDIIQSCTTKYPSNRDLNPGFGEPDIGLWLHVLAGTGHLSPTISSRQLVKSKDRLGINKEVNDIIRNYELDIKYILSNNMDYKNFFKFIRG